MSQEELKKLNLSDAPTELKDAKNKRLRAFRRRKYKEKSLDRVAAERLAARLAEQQQLLAEQQQLLAEQQQLLAEQQQPLAEQQQPLAEQQQPLAEQQQPRQEEEHLVEQQQLYELPNTHDRVAREACMSFDNANSYKVLPRLSFLSQPYVPSNQFKPARENVYLGSAKKIGKP
jgi:hypothetical protein